jgi:hypothetical protein
MSSTFTSPLFQLILSSAVLAALVAAVFNYLTGRKANQRLLEIEKLKHDAELTSFRYTKVYEAIQSVAKLPPVEYSYLVEIDGNLVPDRERLKGVVSRATERFEDVRKIFDQVRPLIDEAELFEASQAIAASEKQSNLITEALYTGQAFPPGVDLVSLIRARQRAEAAISTAMSSQLRALTRAA